MYKPAQHWLWDFWIVKQDEQYHLFYLQAPDDLAHAEMRHVNARIGHAQSQDLLYWQEDGEVFGPADSAAWDSRCIWTGSVLASHHAQAEAKYALLYTGTNDREGSQIQRIGLAWSDDLHHFKRHEPSLVLEHDADLYLGQNPTHADEQAWRDPHLEFDSERQCYWALTTAQLADKDCGHGAIAYSESKDLVHWTVKPPIYSSAAFFLMEIPQFIQIGDYYYLLFSAVSEWIKPQYLPEAFQGMTALTGTYYVYSQHDHGPWQFGGRLCGHAQRMEFGFKIIAHQDEHWGLFWRGYDNMADQSSRFRGELSDPVKVLQQTDGRLETVSL